MNEAVGPFLATDDLEQALELVIAAIREKHGDRIDLDGGLYWRLSFEGPSRLPEDPGEPSVGDLVDDAQEIVAMLADDRQVSLWHDLDHLAHVLLRIAAMDLSRG